MSTRSGKRIHAYRCTSTYTDSPIASTDIIVQSERKTRRKKHKENVEVSVKKNNYVSYPVNEDTATFSSDASDVLEKAKAAGKTRRNTLKERNVHASVSDSQDSNNVVVTVRKSRRGKRVTGESENPGNIENIQSHDQSDPNTNNKKKLKKKKAESKDFVQSDMQDLTNQVTKKKGMKKKKKKKSNSTSMDHQQVGEGPTGIGNTSVDSFYSAAGSPVKSKLVETDNQIKASINFAKNTIENNIFTNIVKPVASEAKGVGSIKRKRKSNVKNSTFDKEEIKDDNINSTFDKSPDLVAASKNRKQSNVSNLTFDKIETIFDNGNLNKTFEKAAATDTIVDVLQEERNTLSNKNSTIDNVEGEDNNEGYLNTTFDQPGDKTLFNTTADNAPNRKRKCSFGKINIKNIDEVNTTLDKSPVLITPKTQIELATKNKRRSSIKNSTYDKIETSSDELNASVITATHTDTVTHSDSIENFNVHSEEKTTKRRRKSSIKNSTYDKIEKDLDNSELREANASVITDDTDPQSSSCDILQENNVSNISKPILNGTFERTSEGSLKIHNPDTTFSKDSNVDLNTTFDTSNKSTENVPFKRSSPARVAATVNVTFEKLRDNSHISITSDESRTDSILIHSPVLVESSIDESLISEDKNPQEIEVPETPLKREGTFTKEAPDVVSSPKPKTITVTTPIKRNSSHIGTPYPHSKSTKRENTKLNVTRSIEKPTGRSSLVEGAAKQAKVMFCSPVNNPAAASQIKGRVIKSNLKGSNKSFVFEDSTSEARSSRRKRSLTTGEAETRAKRKRLGDELQHSVDRLSRPRTVSAAAKIPDPSTPSKRVGTPFKAKPESKASRTKLPNFAALHQKQFAKMESLDECQERKAKRARQLLTPTGCVGMLERISPKDTPPKRVPASKEPATKLHAPSEPKPPKLDSLNPGYTRFGFKLNVDVNPFSVSKKTDGAKEKSNGMTRQATCLALPSRAGATASRREVAKQAVMREKSFSDKRDVKRKESRTVIKGVRTNRRFELQMKLRNINA